MNEKIRDQRESMNLFGENKPLPEGSHYDKNGILLDEKGNQIDAEGEIIYTAEYLKARELAKRDHEDWTEEELGPLIQIYLKQIKARKRQDEKKEK